jgi:hypothetical protein
MTATMADMQGTARGLLLGDVTIKEMQSAGALWSTHVDGGNKKISTTYPHQPPYQNSAARRPIANDATATAASRSSPPAVADVSAIKPYEGFGDVDHTIKELMSL